MSRIYLPWNASKASQRAAEHARAESRRDRPGAVLGPDLAARSASSGASSPSAGMLAPIGGLNPFVAQCAGRRRDTRPARRPARCSACKPFTQPMPRFDVLPRNPVSCLSPAPTAQANQTQQPVDPLLGGGIGPDRRASAGSGLGAPALQRVPAAGRGRGDAGAGDDQLPSTTRGVRARAQLAASTRRTACRCGSIPSCRSRTRTRSGRSTARFRRSWCRARYGEPMLFRHHNGLPADVTPEQRLRPPHDLDARAQRPSRRGERRLHRRVLLPGPVLRLPLADRARRALQRSTPARPIRMASRPTTAAA